MFLIVGLGNPGELYRKTRHNAGFMAVDFISNCHKLIWTHKSKFNADITSGNIDNYKVVFCKPTTFMNLSGNAVLPVMSYYKIELKRLIVIHDDIDLEFGKIKCKIGGGSGGHNGLKSIDEKLGVSYYRVRIGIGKPDRQNSEVTNYVLNNFSDGELSILDSKYEIIAQNIHLLLASELEKFKLQVSKEG
jgi:PTH1 family peptidyl-tRNA hydrolase